MVERVLGRELEGAFVCGPVAHPQLVSAPAFEEELALLSAPMALSVTAALQLLLEVLSDFTISIPELGTIRAASPPLVILTSNRTREVHDALKRRCLYHWLDHPGFDREVAILLRRLPSCTSVLAEQVARAAARLRAADLLKPPGIAETLDWAEALLTLGADRLNPEYAAVTLGAALKYREDQQTAVRNGLLDVWKGVERRSGSGR